MYWTIDDRKTVLAKFFPATFSSMRTASHFGSFTKQLLVWGIRSHLTNDFISEHSSGVAERWNRSLLVTAPPLMLDGERVNKELWGEAVTTANYVRDLPSKVLG